MAVGSEFRGILTGLGLVVATVLLAISVDFGIPGQELLQSLRFHIVAVCLLLPLGLALCGARLRAVIMLALLLLSAGQGGLIITQQLLRRTPPAQLAGTLSFLSFNVLSNNAKAAAVVSYLTDAPPQVAVLMETSAISGSLNKLSQSFPTIVGCASSDDCDTAIFSTLPLEASRIYDFGPFRRHRMVSARLNFHGQTITIVAVHLSKPYFDRTSFVELAELAVTLWWQKGPVILAGDFNAAAWSTAIAGMVADAKLAPPPLFPATWPVELGPFGVPIDNVFSRDGAFIRSISAMPDPLGSNHRGLLASIDIAADTPASTEP